MLYDGFTRISYASIWSAEPSIITCFVQLCMHSDLGSRQCHFHIHLECGSGEFRYLFNKGSKASLTSSSWFE